MTPLELMEAPVKEKVEPKPVVAKPTISPLEQCYNAIEDYRGGSQTETGEKQLDSKAEKQLDLFLASHGFTRDSLNAHYSKTVDYEAASQTIQNQDF